MSMPARSAAWMPLSRSPFVDLDFDSVDDDSWHASSLQVRSLCDPQSPVRVVSVPVVPDGQRSTASVSM